MKIPLILALALNMQYAWSESEPSKAVEMPESVSCSTDACTPHQHTIDMLTTEIVENICRGYTSNMTTQELYNLKEAFLEKYMDEMIDSYRFELRSTELSSTLQCLVKEAVILRKIKNPQQKEVVAPLTMFFQKSFASKLTNKTELTQKFGITDFQVFHDWLLDNFLLFDIQKILSEHEMFLRYIEED